MPRKDLAYEKVNKKKPTVRTGGLRRCRTWDVNYGHSRKKTQVSEAERQPLTELREILRAKLRTIWKAEWHRRRRKERARKRTSFLTDPFGFAKKLLGDKRSGQLNCPTEELNTYLRDNLSDPERDKELGNLEAVIRPHQPTTKFDLEEPSWKEVREVVKAAHSASAPGPSGVPYGVYKRCPSLLLLLWKIIKVIWQRGRVADQWRFAEGVWIPKEENSKEIEQFRSIFYWVLKVKSFSAFYRSVWASICWIIIILTLQYRKAGFPVFRDVLSILE